MLNPASIFIDMGTLSNLFVHFSACLRTSPGFANVGLLELLDGLQRSLSRSRIAAGAINLCFRTGRFYAFLYTCSWFFSFPLPDFCPKCNFIKVYVNSTRLWQSSSIRPIWLKLESELGKDEFPSSLISCIFFRKLRFRCFGFAINFLFIAESGAAPWKVAGKTGVRGQGVR